MTITDADAPRITTLKAAAEWGVLISGVLSLAFAVLATTTGIVSADATDSAVTELVGTE